MSTTEEVILICASRIRNLMHRELGRHFAEHGLTLAQFSVLEVLLAKGDLSVGEIQEKVLGTPGNIPGIINNLVKAGYVTKTPDEKDRRVSRVSMTEAGRELLAGIYPHPHQEWLEEILSPLSADERKTLASTLLKSYQKMAKRREEPSV